MMSRRPYVEVKHFSMEVSPHSTEGQGGLDCNIYFVEGCMHIVHCLEKRKWELGHLYD